MKSKEKYHEHLLKFLMPLLFKMTIILILWIGLVRMYLLLAWDHVFIYGLLLHQKLQNFMI